MDVKNKLIGKTCNSVVRDDYLNSTRYKFVFYFNFIDDGEKTVANLV